MTLSIILMSEMEGADLGSYRSRAKKQLWVNSLRMVGVETPRGRAKKAMVVLQSSNA